MRRIHSTFTAPILCALHAGAAPPNNAYPGSWLPATFPAEVSTDNIGVTVQAGEYLPPSYNYGATVWHLWYARVSGPCVVNSGVIPTGQTLLTMPLYLPPDSMADGDQTVTFTAISSGYLNGTGAPRASRCACA